MAPALTTNAVGRILSDAPAEGYEPTLQVLSVRTVRENRFGVVVSDGEEFTNALLASQCNDKVASGAIDANAVIKVTKYMVNKNGDKKMMSIFSLDVLESGAAIGLKIGEPRDFSKPVASSTTPKRPTAPAVDDTPAETPSVKSSTVTPATKGSSATKTPPSQKGAVVRATDNVRTVPITALNPYQNAWTIKARLVVKGEIRKYARGDGCLFKMTFMDAAGDEIEAVAFKEAAEKFEAVVEEGVVYFVSGGRIKVANKQYSSTKCGYDITLSKDSRIERANDQQSIGGASFDFVKINALEQTEVGSIIDVVAVVKAAEDARDIESKKLGNRLLTKRDVTLVDDSGAEVRLTLWGDKAKAEQVDWEAQPVVTLKGVKVAEYNGRQLSILQSTRVAYDPPDVPAVEALRAWWASGGQEAATQSLSRGGAGGAGGTFEPSPPDRRTTFEAMKNNPRLGHGDRPDVVEFKASLAHVRTERMWYEACPTCQKKAVATADGASYHCEKCNKAFPDCEHRYISSVKLVDATGDSWFSLFNDQGIALFGGHTADHLASIAGEGVDKLDDFVKQFFYAPLHFKARIKTEQWQEQTRVKANITHIAKVDFAHESKFLIDALSK